MQGRPSIFTEKLGKEICARISDGESVRAICRDKKMPSASTVFYWLLDDDKQAFLEQYETARNTQAENMFEELLDIADTEQDIQKARLKIDTRKWYLSKVLPKKFGDKIDMTSAGEKVQPLLVKIIGKDESSNGDTD